MLEPKTHAAKQVTSSWTVNSAQSNATGTNPSQHFCNRNTSPKPFTAQAQWRQTPSDRDAFREGQNPLAAWACMSPSTDTATRQLPQAHNLKRCIGVEPSNARAPHAVSRRSRTLKGCFGATNKDGSSKPHPPKSNKCLKTADSELWLSWARLGAAQRALAGRHTLKGFGV